MSKAGSGGHPKAKAKFPNSLVALSSAAVMAVYSAGYVKTRAAADRFAAQSFERRPARPAPTEPLLTAAVTPVRVESPATLTPAPTPTPNPTAVKAPETKTPEARVAETKTPETKAPVGKAPEPVATAQPESPAPVATPAPPPAPVAPAPPPPPVWKDGTYFGWGSSRHGDIQAQVVVEGGKIAAATIAQCLTRYSCSVIDKLPPQVAQRQSPEVDYVSGATQSTNAFYYAVVEALAKAK